MGKHQLRLLKFAIRFPGWHTYVKGDRAIREALYSLVKLDLIEINEFHQFKLKGRDDELYENSGLTIS